jgi:hypothetical protein
LFVRQPGVRELRLGVEFLASGNSCETPAADAVQKYAHALLGSNEFLFVD